MFELNHEGPRDSEAQALADGNALLAARDARWDAREALVFLQDHHRVVPDLPRAGRYLLGYVETIRGVHFDVYSLGSRWDKLWLPSSSPGGAAGAAGASAEQRFLLDVPASGSEASSTRSVRSGGTPTITLAAMKAEVAGIEQEIAAGGGSDAYRDCLYEKYRWSGRSARMPQEAITTSATMRTLLPASPPEPLSIRICSFLCVNSVS